MSSLHRRALAAAGSVRAAAWAVGASVLLAACGTDQPERLKTADGRDSVVTVNSIPTAFVAAIAPSSYRGTLPCADCSGIATTLSVFTDSTYRIAQRYEGKGDEQILRMGRWRYEDRRLVLEGQTGPFLQFAHAAADTLRLLDQAGQPITSSAPLTLARTDSLDGLRGTSFWTGTFTYLADAPTFRECVSGQTYPVLMKGAYRATERAYLAAKLAPGSGWQIEVAGRFVERPADMEGARDRDAFEIVKFLGPGANTNCR